jgi:23S rRNA (adenine2503-C2)-methyltransferase
MKLPVSGMLPDEINSIIKSDKKYRAAQIFKAMHNGTTDFSLMRNLPIETRKILSENFCIISSISSKVLKDNENNGKISIVLADKNIIECVILSDSKERKTACLSTQAGCAMGCIFCKTGEGGFFRNLSAAEIVEQFILLEKEFGKISNIVFMGMGEPLENTENLLKAAAVLNHREGSGISFRKMTISTCGIADKIYFIADNAPPLRLAVSLNSAEQKKREKIMPAAKKFPLEELKKALLYYQSKQGKRITLEYVLIKNFNTEEHDAKQLKKFIAGLSAMINIIPWNPAPGIDLETPDKREIEKFCLCLDAFGINYAVRRKKGGKIRGACGQLASESSIAGDEE